MIRRLLSRKFEAALVRLAAWILMGRNATRCRVVSRRDNNDMWHMGERLEGIAGRMSSGYKGGGEA